jgi:hypothetical protein
VTPTPFAPTVTFRDFLRDQGRRALVRWFTLRYSVIAVAFWTLALTLGAWLTHWGLAWLAWALLLAWTYFALPALMVQVQAIVDVLGYYITGRTHFYPLLLELANTEEFRRKTDPLSPGAQRFLRRTERLFVFAGNTTPIVGIAVWAFIVLVRMPARAHVRVTRTELKHAVSTARHIESVAAHEFAGRHFAGAA